MKRKILFSILAIIMCLTLVGCGKEEKQNNTLDDIIEKFTNSEKDDKDNSSKNNDNKESTSLDEIKLYSDDTKMVFNFYDQYNIVYHYKGDTITGLELYYDYGTEELAKISKSAIEQTQDYEIKSVVQKGRYVIVTYNEEAYQDMTVEEVKQTYSYLEQVYEE